MFRRNLANFCQQRLLVLWLFRLKLSHLHSDQVVRHYIVILICATGAVYNYKVVFWLLQSSSSKSTSKIFLILQPFERSVVCNY